MIFAQASDTDPRNGSGISRDQRSAGHLVRDICLKGYRATIAGTWPGSKCWRWLVEMQPIF